MAVARHWFWILLYLAALAGLLGRDGDVAAAPARAQAVDRGGLTFDAGVDPASRAAIETALAEARPQARALIDRVDGFVTVAVGRPPSGALGSASSPGDGTYSVLLDLGETYRSTGSRGVTRLVLHELGHVIDFALVDDTLGAQMDAGIPPGMPCPAGTQLGSCAPGPERFAETFAKWAMGNDLGVDLYIGYAVPAPASFDAWAAPLAALAG